MFKKKLAITYTIQALLNPHILPKDKKRLKAKYKRLTRKSFNVDLI